MSGDDLKDPPIEEMEYLVRQVIDLGDFRVARGMSRRPTASCQHRQLRYDLAERRVWCADCESTIDGFDAFMVLASGFQTMLNKAMELMREAETAKAAVIHRLAAREIERIWRMRMAASCPHCHRGILPHDGLGAISAELELARRSKE